MVKHGSLARGQAALWDSKIEEAVVVIELIIQVIIGRHKQIDESIVVVVAPRRGSEPDGVVDGRHRKDARKGAIGIVVVEKAAAVDPAATPVRHKEIDKTVVVVV